MPDEDDIEEPSGQEESPVIKTLRTQVTEKDERNKALQQENAILKAGLGDLTVKQQKALLASHDGEITADSLKATADELGFTKHAGETETPQVPADEQAEIRRAQEATGTGTPSSASEVPVEQLIAQAKTEAELDAITGLHPLGERT